MANADVIDYKIHGDDIQLVEIELDPGEGARTEVGAMMYKGNRGQGREDADFQAR